MISHPLIHLHDIQKTYKGGTPYTALKGFSLDIERGEFLAVMGASGSGKSTLLNIIGLLDSYDTGEYLLDGMSMKNLDASKAADYRSQLIGFIFQSFNLIPYKDAIENVALPLLYQGIRRSERNKRAFDMLNKVGLSPWAHHRPSSMSGGQKQRVAIARALVTRPKLILADEPTGALDSETSFEVMQLLSRLHQRGMTIVLVTHERKVAEWAGRIIHLKDGCIESIEQVQNMKECDMRLR